jgi:hypothetical protein
MTNPNTNPNPNLTQTSPVICTTDVERYAGKYLVQTNPNPDPNPNPNFDPNPNLTQTLNLTCHMQH